MKAKNKQKKLKQRQTDFDKNKDNQGWKRSGSLRK